MTASFDLFSSRSILRMIIDITILRITKVPAAIILNRLDLPQQDATFPSCFL